MINYDSILSAFDGKPTLLQWLKMVKKSLDESILKNVNITQNGQKVVFTFNFEDGTSIITPEVTLPKGDKGDKGNTGENGVGIVRIETTGSKIVGDDTESNIRVELSDGSIKNFKTYAKNGSNGLNGENGVSIIGINTVRDEVVGDKTLTTLRANYSNNKSDEFVVTAKNGSGSSGSNIFFHQIVMVDNDRMKRIYFVVYSTKRILQFEDALSFLPENSGFPVWFSLPDGNGVGTASKFSDRISLSGIGFNPELQKAMEINVTFIPSTTIEDILIGENL